MIESKVPEEDKTLSPLMPFIASGCSTVGRARVITFGFAAATGVL